MRFSEAWLREWVNPQISTQELADQLSMAGLEVDSVEPAAPLFEGVVVGEVLTREQHPDADKLSVCAVNVGAGGPLQIVCGANNVAAGMRVPVATVGARLPGDFKIKKAKLRGVQSLGMICSAAELGLAESSDGILPLSPDAPVGRDLREFMALDDACIEVDLTPDRGDCLSVGGIAREVGVINREPVTPPRIPAVPAALEDRFAVNVLAPQACPHYACRVVRNIDAAAGTPQWMVERLRRSGVRAISPVVDVTNYVMLELGQPMHGFDLNRLREGIQVRMARAGETLALLDGSELELRPDSLVIADAGGPLALAGIMGGDKSGVTDTTRDILLESAFFAPLALAGKARSYGLHTDSSHRFERGVDPGLPVTALERATSLLQDIVGGQPGPVVAASSAEHLPEPRPVRLRRERVGRVLGVDIDDARIEDILTRLGMRIGPADDGWDVTAPSARFDIAIEVDLIEEIGRIYGYARIPESLTSAPVSIVATPEAGFSLQRAKQTLVDRDFQETISYSFISPEMARIVTPVAQPITLANPISSDMAVMRASLWPGLLTTLKYNLARQQERVRIFESGLRFDLHATELKQEPCLSGVAYGAVGAEQWGAPARAVDFYDLKADVEAVLGQVGDDETFDFAAAEHAVLHPGQSAVIQRHGATVGFMGALHPAVKSALELPGEVYLFELFVSQLEAGTLPAFTPLSKFPAIRRDLALVVDRSVSFAAVRDCVRRAAPSIVRDIRLFDVYTGEKIDSSLKSLALGLILQESSHTLTEQEVEHATVAILTALGSELSAKLRD